MIAELKICGFTRVSDLYAALDAGVDYTGVVLVPGSLRRVTLEDASFLFAPFSAFCGKVCVTANLSMRELLAVIAKVKPDILQLHGNESPEVVESLGRRIEVWKAVHLRTEEDVCRASEYPCSRLIADGARGGSGKSCDWNLVARLAQKRTVMVAGGIHAGNLREALQVTGAAGADICGGAESAPGMKSKEKINQLTAIIQKKEMKQ